MVEAIWLLHEVIYCEFSSYWVDDPDRDLEHYGVKGMNWGVRREAKRDARESVRAQMSYGEGAGNCRKPINKSVEAKKKKDPNYAEAFDYYREREDVAKAGQNARRWRKKQDRKKRPKVFVAVPLVLLGTHPQPPCLVPLVWRTPRTIRQSILSLKLPRPSVEIGLSHRRKPLNSIE